MDVWFMDYFYTMRVNRVCISISRSTASYRSIIMNRRIYQQKKQSINDSYVSHNNSGETKLDKTHHFKLNELYARQNLSLACVAYTNKIPTNHYFVNLKFVKARTENQYSAGRYYLGIWKR